MATYLPQETIRRQRDGISLSAEELTQFVSGIADGRIGDAQLGAFAMAVLWRGLSTTDCVALTLAMRDSGKRLRWQIGELPGPIVDKHSTGGIGDAVSLVLGPMLAACGCFVPMISGRGLGHTGGTLDKLEAIPGYRALAGEATMRRVVREAGIAIVGADAQLAPADRRLYAVRDVTATVESIPLITASILSKKLAAGLQHLVLDVKFGNGAFMAATGDAQALAQSLVDVATGAGLPTNALLTDMNEPLAPCAGNAIEVRMALDVLTGRTLAPRFQEVVLALGAELLIAAKLAANEAAASALLQQSIDSGAAAERFARMVHGLGGPSDLLERADALLPKAPVIRPVPWPAHAMCDGRNSRIARIATRELGLAVVRLGGGRLQLSDLIDPAVGFSALAAIGAANDGTPLAWVHAANDAAADAAIAAVQAACEYTDQPMAGPAPVIAQRITPRNTPP